MGQHHSPYLAMGNNPVSSIDLDGGWDNEAERDLYNQGEFTFYDYMANKYNPDAYSHSEFDNNYNHGGALGGFIDASGQYYSNNSLIYDAHQSWIANHILPIQEDVERQRVLQNRTNDVALVPVDDEGNGTLDDREVIVIGQKFVSSSQMYDYISAKGKKRETSFFQSVKNALANSFGNLDNKLGAGLFGSANNYNAIKSHAGNDNPYMFTYQEMKDITNAEMEIASMFIPVGEIFQGIKWAGRGIGLISKAEGRFFWSGGKIAFEKATKEAILAGGKTLEMSKRGQLLIALTKVLPFKYTEPLWKIASKTWAAGAEGSAKVFLYPPGMRASPIWNIESEILKDNYVEIIETILK